MTSECSLPLERQLISILGSNREDSYATQRKRAYILAGAAREIVAHFGLQKWDNLKLKHVTHLVERWKADDAGRRSIDEKLTHLRWLLRKIGKPVLLPRTNAELGIAPGPRHTRAGNVLTPEQFGELTAKLTDPRIRGMVLLARWLGLRFEEAALWRPWRDFDGERVWVKRGTKGGRPRYVNLHDTRQRAVIDIARGYATGDGALIPKEYETYEQWRQYVYRQLREAGIGRATDVLFHDIRRTFICERMRYLVDAKGMAVEQAAVIVAREAGHSRVEVLRWYLDCRQMPSVAPTTASA